MAHATHSDWEYIKSRPEKAAALPDVSMIAHQVWDEMRENCGLNQVKLDVAYDWKRFLLPEYSNILAYASRTMWLIDDKWISTALTGVDDLDGFIHIRVNPFVPNGWFVDDGRCNIGNHFDLKTVLRHELLHGVGISSSLRPTGLGYYHNLLCYPLQFDTLIETEEGQRVVHGCNLSTSVEGDLFVNREKLYNPDVYISGSSYSHSSKGIMFASIPARKCQNLDSTAVNMLEGLGAHCETIHATSAGTIACLSHIILFIILLLNLKN